MSVGSWSASNSPDWATTAGSSGVDAATGTERCSCGSALSISGWAKPSAQESCSVASSIGDDHAGSCRTGGGAESTDVSWSGSFGDQRRDCGADIGTGGAVELSWSGSLIILRTVSGPPRSVDTGAGGATNPGLIEVVRPEVNSWRGTVVAGGPSVGGIGASPRQPGSGAACNETLLRPGCGDRPRPHHRPICYFSDLPRAARVWIRPT
jgi:hypothetical protein